MLLSDWYLNWKEKRIKAAAEKARDEGYQEGYAAGKKVAKSGKGTHVVTHRRRKDTVVTHGKDAGSIKRGGKVK